MRSWLRRCPWSFLAVCLAALWACACGSDKVPPGGFCESDDQCQEGLVCDANTCKNPDTDE